MPKTIAKLKRYLDMVPELSSRTLLSYSHLTQGVTNESYNIKFAKDEYVIKFFNHQAMELGIDHKKELLVLSRLEAIEIAPTVIYIDLDEEFSIARWLEGVYWSEEDFAQPEKLTALVSRIKQLHQTDTQGMPVLDLLACINSYRQRLINRDIAPELTRDLYLLKAQQLIQQMQSRGPDCLCHNDLLATNILCGEQMYFLDWEFAGVNSPLFELTVLCRGNRLTAEQQQQVLASYFDQDWQSYLPLINDLYWLYDYLELLWTQAVREDTDTWPEGFQEKLDQFLSHSQAF